MNVDHVVKSVLSKTTPLGPVPAYTVLVSPSVLDAKHHTGDSLTPSTLPTNVNVPSIPLEEFDDSLVEVELGLDSYSSVLSDELVVIK